MQLKMYWQAGMQTINLPIAIWTSLDPFHYSIFLRFHIDFDV